LTPMHTNGHGHVVVRMRVLDCGGKRSATPLWEGACQTKSGVVAALVLRVPLIVPEGQNMNSRGRKPTVSPQNIFDPVGVAHFLHPSPWGFTHGYSCSAASRPSSRGSLQNARAALCHRSPRFSDSDAIRVHSCPFVISQL
jgi:hypothetical protein